MSTKQTGEKDIYALDEINASHPPHLGSPEVIVSEVHNAVLGEEGEGGTRRELKPRQMSMIAIGGAIGTGLILGSGTSLARSGPASCFIAYSIVGSVVYGALCALAEMSTLYPTKKGFAGHGTRFVDEAFGFVTALLYLCKYFIVSPSQIIAFSLIIRYWNSEVNGAVWVTILLIFVIGMNFAGIKWFGEFEFWCSFTKILILSGLILLSLIIDLGGVPGQDRIGFRYWKDGKAFKAYKEPGSLGRFLGFMNALVLAVFAYSGTEIVGVTVGEAKNPRVAVPKAVKQTFWRIAIFYCFGILVVGMAVDSSSTALAQANSKGTAGGANASPFVVAVVQAGIRFVPSIANAGLLVFTISAANSDQYIASRTLYGMARDGHAPKIFMKCNKRGVPWVAFCITSPFMMLAYLVSSSNSLTVFNYFSSAISLFGGLIWVCILSSHIAFMRAMKAQGVSRDTLPYRAPFMPYYSYYSLFVICIVCFFKGFDAFMPFNYKNFITHYIGIPVFVIGYFGFRFFKGVRSPSPAEVDLQTGLREFEELEEVVDIEGQKLTLKQKAFSYLKNW
ncbi:hypothetical protein I302_100004 [Kwoniella bestiolae CBS 10118]|uniref:Amino acid transporter n=1 Tax=Kwoniella bestiolae CBS 10118 TaxID=1296100 RepID=A0A1B9G3W1_9TREE|nr:amino acid transporter [Kwoniella bestiolae CBS 10118]OCF25703.1 amino acid transporter [Kwoniella bestiolae CBS 10118]